MMSGHRAAGLTECARLWPHFVLYGLLKHAMPIARLVRLAWREPGGQSGLDVEQKVIGRVLRVGAFAGWPDRDCLQRSLLLYQELSRVGARPDLVVGFRKDERGVAGHAWVTVRGQVVAETPDAPDRFVPALRFGPDGALLGPPAQAERAPSK